MRLLWNPHGEAERDNEGRKMATTGLGLMGGNLADCQNFKPFNRTLR